MGDISNETSMEDILSSIKRIIAEEGESALTRSTSRKPRRVVSDDEQDEQPLDRDPADAVLELREAVAEAVEHPDRVARYAARAEEAAPKRSGEPQRERKVAPRPEAVAGDDDAERIEAPSPAPTPAPAARAADGAQSASDDDTILSRKTADASRGQLETLSRLIVKPDIHGSDTLEGLVREMLRPMLRDWLDANLPDMVERMVQREIARITERGS